MDFFASKTTEIHFRFLVHLVQSKQFIFTFINCIFKVSKLLIVGRCVKLLNARTTYNKMGLTRIILVPLEVITEHVTHLPKRLFTIITHFTRETWLSNLAYC